MLPFEPEAGSFDVKEEAGLQAFREAPSRPEKFFAKIFIPA